MRNVKDLATCLYYFLVLQPHNSEFLSMFVGVDNFFVKNIFKRLLLH